LKIATLIIDFPFPLHCHISWNNFIKRKLIFTPLEKIQFVELLHKFERNPMKVVTECR